MSFINFQSLTEIQKNRGIEREERQLILDKAKKKYEKKLRAEKEAGERGETTWMLSSVEDKINSEQKKKKKRKKEKKEKKEKKAKKKEKKEQSSSSSSLSLESEHEENQADVWVEKTLSEQPAKREEWMELSSLFKTQTREQMKMADGKSRALKKLEERKRKEEENKPGSHARELNPYYKEGGSGLPSEMVVVSSTVRTSYSDAAWLRKALQRAKDQAIEEGKKLEDVAVERWGSLDAFYKLLNEAEEGAKLGSKYKNNSSETDKDMSKRREKGCSRDERERIKENYKNERSESKAKRKRSQSRSGSRDRNRSRSKDRKNRRDRSGSRSSSRSRRSRRDRSRSRCRNNSSSSRESSRSRSKKGSSSRSKRRSGERSKFDEKSRIENSGSSSKRSTNCSRNYHKKRNSSTNSSDSSSSRSSSNSSSVEKNVKRAERRKDPRNEKSERLQMLKPPESDDEIASNSQRSNLLLKPDDETDLSTDSFQNKSNFVTKSKSALWRKKVIDTSEKITDSEVVASPKSSRNSSSSSGSDSEDKEKSSKMAAPSMKENPATEIPLLTDKEMNQLGAKLTKAELLGNTALVEKLKSKLDAARSAREKQSEQPSDFGPKYEEENIVILTRTDKSGFTRPVEPSAPDDRGSKKKKKPQMFDEHGNRTSYLEDDFRVDLKNMFEKEKTTSAEDQIAALNNLPRYSSEKLLGDDFDVDDMFIAKVAPKESEEKERERDRKKAIWEHQKTQKALDSCHFCIDNKLMKKHLIVALGKKCYVSLPYHQSLTEGHCMIIPLHHVPCGTQADEDLWEEVTNFRHALVRMFTSNDEDCVFFETATKLHQVPHMVLQCIPLPKEVGDLAPIYFKKAILECDEEWAQNKKLVDLKGRNVRKAVPKGLPYFYVDFGMTPGFAHVIENENLFPNNFAQEIIGGMIDADYSLYRKPKSENFDLQRKKVLKFGKMFQPFDPIQVD